MRDETKLVLETMTGHEKYDEACKQTWKLKEVIAPVLQCAIKEYQGYSVDEVIRFINADTISDNVPVDDLPVFVKALNAEMSSTTEKRVYYDIHFTAKNPKLSTEDIIVMLHIDFEVQNDYTPSNPTYPITKRAVYYVARELSAQLGVVTDTTDYDKLEKVYSIWICNENVPTELKNSITRYYVKREDVVGECTEPIEYHDLMELVIIRRDEVPLEDTIFEYLEGVFTSNLAIVEKYVDVKENHEVKEALKTMCGLGESIENKALKRGREQGIEQGIEQGKEQERIRTIQKMISRGDSKEEILELDYTEEEYLKAKQMM